VQKISITINAVLLVAIAVLFYMVISLKNKVSPSDANDSFSVTTAPLPKAEGKIMYVNVDSLKAKYNYYIQIETELTNESKVNENDIQGKVNKLKKDYLKYQEQAQAGILSQEQLMGAQNDIAMQEKAIGEREEELGKIFAKNLEKKNKQFLQYTLDFLKRKSKEHNYSYVMGYTEGANLLYVNDSLDITNQVVSGLNAEYKVEQEKKKK
jgi:outer membrane protein